MIVHTVDPVTRVISAVAEVVTVYIVIGIRWAPGGRYDEYRGRWKWWR
jgi:hypothetical protein